MTCSQSWSMWRRYALAITFLASCACNDAPARNEHPAPSLGPAPIAAPSSVPPSVELPRRPGSIRFAAIGDAGRGDRAQYETAAQLAEYRNAFPFDFVIMLGDNVYDGGTPEDYRRKFEQPYERMLKAGVTFHAAIGNHDDPNQPSYPLFNMGGQRYYVFEPKHSVLDKLTGTSVRFFMIDTERLDRTQLRWLDRELEKSTASWEVAVFHRPLYTSGRYARPARLLRSVLEPVLVHHGVMVAFSGHEHFYERIKPQHGITYFIAGAAGALRLGDIRPTPLTARGFDQDNHFMLVEIVGDELFYQAVSRTGATIDYGVISRD